MSTIWRVEESRKDKKRKKFKRESVMIILMMGKINLESTSGIKIRLKFSINTESASLKKNPTDPRCPLFLFLENYELSVPPHLSLSHTQKHAHIHNLSLTDKQSYV